MKLYLLICHDAHNDYLSFAIRETQEGADERLAEWTEMEVGVLSDLSDGWATPIEFVDGYRIIVGEKVE